jgi:iron complex transport system substrate-binding protein
MDTNAVTAKIIESAITVHRELGPGLLESVYQRCLAIELKERGLETQSEVAVPVYYKGCLIGEDSLRLDLLVNGQIVVELKSVAQIQPVHAKQLLTYLRLSKKPLGLLINFNEVLLKNGITRIVNNY